MKIRGVLRDDMRTRALLVESPAHQLELLVHVLLEQGHEVELRCDGGRLSGDPVLVAYTERCIEKRTSVAAHDGSPVRVSTADPDSIVVLLARVLEARTVTVDDEDEADLTA